MIFSGHGTERGGLVFADGSELLGSAVEDTLSSSTLKKKIVDLRGWDYSKLVSEFDDFLMIAPLGIKRDTFKKLIERNLFLTPKNHFKLTAKQKRFFERFNASLLKHRTPNENVPFHIMDGRLCWDFPFFIWLPIFSRILVRIF